MNMDTTPPGGFNSSKPPRLRRLSRWRRRAIAENRELRADLEAARRLNVVYQLMLNVADYGDPPPNLVHALRSGRPRANVVIDGQHVVIGLCSVQRPVDPITEHLAWRAHVDVHRRVAGEHAIPDATGLRLADLPAGHCYQVWVPRRGSLIVVVNRRLPRFAARAALRGALKALRLHAVVLPLLYWAGG